MTLRRSDPLQDLLSLQEKMGRLFEESLARTGGRSAFGGPGTWSPLADVQETADAYIVLVELPGLSPDEVDVDVEADALTVRGQRRVASSARPDSFHRMERSYGPFRRSFRFPEDVDPARVAAQFRDGLLRLELPKARPYGARGRSDA